MTRIDHIADLSLAGRNVPDGTGGFGRVPSTISTITMTTTTMPSRAGTG